MLPSCRLRILALAPWVAASCVAAPRPPAVEPEPVIAPASVAAQLEPADTVVAEVREMLPDARTRARVVELLRKGRQAEGPDRAAALEAAEELVPRLAGWARVIGMEAAALSADSAALRRAAEVLPPGPARAWGHGLLVRALAAAGDDAAALRAAEWIADQPLPGGAAAEAWKRVGDLRVGLGDEAGAGAAYRSAMEADPGSPAGLEAARAAVELAAPAPDVLRLAGSTLLQHGGLDRGTAALDAFVTSGAGSDAERSAARLEAGRALFGARRYAAAVRYLEPAAEVSPEAALLLARSTIRRGREREGREALARVGERFAGHEAATEAWLLLGELAHGAGQAQRAREMLRNAIRSGVHSTAAAEAAARLAGIALLHGEPAAALPDLEQFLATRPRDRVIAPALYWAGRLRAETGGDARTLYEEARRADPVSYYGVRAAERLGAGAATLPLSAPPIIDAGAEREAEWAFLRMDVLREVGMPEAAAFELAWLRDSLQHDPAALYLVAEGMMSRGQPIAGALLGLEIQRRRGAWDERLLRIVYQFPYRDLVEREASRHGLDPFLVAGLIRQESYFNARAVSRAGAIGLMQVMPATGRGLARRVGLRGFTPDDLRDPEINVRLGTLFLADQVRRYRTLTEVFAAYNAGPGRVARWRSFPEFRDEDLFVERIPFEETRTYAKRVRLHRHLYEFLYGRGGTEPGGGRIAPGGARQEPRAGW